MRSTRAVFGREGLGSKVEKALAADAWQINKQIMSELPGDSALVRTQVASHASHVVLAGYYRSEALRAGLLTDRGMLLMDRSMAHDVRAERLAVTAFALSKASARQTKKGQKPVDYEALALEEAKKGR